MLRPWKQVLAPGGSRRNPLISNQAGNNIRV